MVCIFCKCAWRCLQRTISPSRYKGVKEASISQNAAYYVFSQCADGSFEAHPVDSFYRFTPNINYRTLTADEAEEEFSLRNKTINYFSLMVKKRLVDTDEKANEEEIIAHKVKSKVDKLVIMVFLIYKSLVCVRAGVILQYTQLLSL